MIRLFIILFTLISSSISIADIVCSTDDKVMEITFEKDNTLDLHFLKIFKVNGEVVELSKVRSNFYLGDEDNMGFRIVSTSTDSKTGSPIEHSISASRFQFEGFVGDSGMNIKYSGMALYFQEVSKAEDLEDVDPATPKEKFVPIFCIL